MRRHCKISESGFPSVRIAFSKSKLQVCFNLGFRFWTLNIPSYSQVFGLWFILRLHGLVSFYIVRDWDHEVMNMVNNKLRTTASCHGVDIPMLRSILSASLPQHFTFGSSEMTMCDLLDCSYVINVKGVRNASFCRNIPKGDCESVMIWVSLQK